MLSSCCGSRQEWTARAGAIAKTNAAGGPGKSRRAVQPSGSKPRCDPGVARDQEWVRALRLDERRIHHRTPRTSTGINQRIFMTFSHLAFIAAGPRPGAQWDRLQDGKR